MSFQDIFQITEKKQQTENQQLFDRIIDVTLFDIVEGLDKCCTYMNDPSFNQEKPPIPGCGKILDKRWK